MARSPREARDGAVAYGRFAPRRATRYRAGLLPDQPSAPPAAAYAASANRATASCRHCRHAAGIVGLATWMKTCGLGAVGVRRGCMPAFSGIESPLRRLHGAQDATMLSQLELPPFERGMTWSTVRFEREPQYWHAQPSRAKTARRVILRRCVSRGTFT